MKYRRIFTIVIDSFGIGAMDNAAEYGDTGVILLVISQIRCQRLRSRILFVGIDTASSSPCFDKPAAVRPHWKICEIK